MIERKGIIFVVSAPSGTGKTTLVERLVHRVPALTMSRSYTSRERRLGEVDGVDYNFISREAFEAKIARGEFIEWADVFGHYYGTDRADTAALEAQGFDVVLVIDVQGERQVRASGMGMVGIFVLPPSFAVLEERLRGRSRDTEEAMARRLATARSEVAGYNDYDYVVVNDDLEPAIDRLRAIVLAERARRGPMTPVAERIVRTFGLGAPPPLAK